VSATPVIGVTLKDRRSMSERSLTSVRSAHLEPDPPSGPVRSTKSGK